jgi:Undecaprenyl-phosphate galactose phosphotransferase WbaP
VILLGNKYKLLDEDMSVIEKHFSNFTQISIDDSDVNQEIKNALIKTRNIIVLNLEHDIKIDLKSYLEELNYNDIEIISFYDFSNKYLNKCPVEVNKENYQVLEDIKQNRFKDFAKRIFDVIFSTVALILLTPIFIIIAILMKFISPGPIFFGHKRIGQNGKFFRVYKFRTMVPNAEEILNEWLQNNPEIKKEYEKDFKLKDDPRIVPIIGNFMRKSSLDELPQFFNSLIGNMSVVGPRPIVEKELEKYHRFAPKLLTVKPGVTGLWQVSGRNDISYEERVRLDVWYVRNWSMELDIMILVKTAAIVVMRKGSY